MNAAGRSSARHPNLMSELVHGGVTPGTETPRPLRLQDIEIAPRRPPSCNELADSAVMTDRRAGRPGSRAFGRELADRPARGRHAPVGHVPTCGDPIRDHGVVGTARHRAPMLGRHAALDALDDSAWSIGADSGSLVLLGGDAGTGKTRLLEEFAARLGQTPALWGSCVDASDAFAYAPWRELLAGARPRVRRRGGRRRSRRLSRVLSGIGGEGPPATTDGPAALFDAVLSVRQHACRVPLVCVLEDVHWIDHASQDLLLAVLSGLRRLPVLLVVSYRLDAEDSGRRELFAHLARGAVRVTLEPLTSESSRDVAAALTGAELDSPEVARIVERAAGNPLFIEDSRRRRRASCRRRCEICCSPGTAG